MRLNKKQQSAIIKAVRKCPTEVKIRKNIAVGDGDVRINIWVSPGNTESLLVTGELKAYNRESVVKVCTDKSGMEDKVIGQLLDVMSKQFDIRGYAEDPITLVIEKDVEPFVVLLHIDCLTGENSGE